MEDKSYKLKCYNNELYNLKKEIYKLENEIEILKKKINEQSLTYKSIISDKNKFEEKLLSASNSLNNGKKEFENASTLVAACMFLSNGLDLEKKNNLNKIEKNIIVVEKTIKNNKTMLDSLKERLRIKKDRYYDIIVRINKLQMEDE